ncbi:alpha-ketoacid dehydrogenase subunit beta [Salinibaculum salinum]|uniref:alpha-ketoacid dehydrogenase subunit beta n=1 Tax=Salinibaculum salinum TaxID=3131996 RepID=UPI0030EB7FEA
MSETTTETETERLTLVESVSQALHDEMESDEKVVVMGEDVGQNEGVFRATEGLYDEFGEQRVIDTPLAESGIVGTAIGMSFLGVRPVAEIQFMGFIYPAVDQLLSHAARFRSRTRGRFVPNIVVRAPYGGGIHSPESHSESTEALFTHYPGLKVVVPSTPYDTKGLLISAIREPDPVLFLEPKKIYRSFREEVPTGTYEIPLGDAAVRREGSDVSVFTWGAMTKPVSHVAETLEGDVDMEVVDLRSLAPMDRETIIESVKKTGRAVVVHEAHQTGGLAGEVVSTIQENALLHLEAPIERVTGWDVPYPLPELEDYYLVNAARITDAVEEVVNFP